MVKPVLYHGSPAKVVKFMPRDGFDAGRKSYVGTLATDSRQQAMLYALKVKEGFNPATGAGALGGVKDAVGNDATDFMLANNLFGNTQVAIFRNRSKYLAALKQNGGGGNIYTMPGETFEALPRPPRTPTTEWLSTSTEIAPAVIERVTLDGAMREGAQVLFLKDGVDIKKLVQEHAGEFDEGPKQLALYKKLISEGVLINENGIRGIANPLDLPIGPGAWEKYITARRGGQNAWPPL